MIVEAGGCELPLSVSKTLLVKDGGVISNNVNRLVQTPLSELAVIPEVTPSLHTVEENTPVSSESKSNTTPPPELLKGMKPDCIEAFVRMWERLPTHLRDINFGLQHDAWSAKDIDRLAELLIEHKDRFSRHKTDLGHCTTLPFRIELKPGSRPVKQRAYRRSPIINRKIQVEIDR